MRYNLYWMEEQQIAFPYINQEDVIYFEEIVEPSHQLKQKPDAELYRRFPWLEFKNSEHKKKYTYLGRETEHNHPFYVRFNLSEETEEGPPELRIS
jgi:hypothetical protein